MSDLISRSSIFNYIKAQINLYGKPFEGTAYEFGLKVMDYIENATPVEAVQVVHGEWIKQKQNPEVMKAFHEMGIGKGMSENSIYWTCSECGGWGTLTHNFCQNCGADMRKKVE